jgi:gas vesicle protein
LFQPDDIQEFAEKLKKILTADQAELDRLSENSLHLIQSHDIERTLTIFEGLYRGDQDGGTTSDDNDETYTKAIGILPEPLRNRVEELRERARALREAATDLSEEVRDEVREKFEDIRDEVVERTKAVNSKVKKTAKKTATKAKKVVKNAAERLKNDED